MRSLESRRHHDMDQVDLEHVSRIGRETTWDDLKNVPFMGDDPDKKKEALLKRMDEIGSFGRGTRVESVSAPDVNRSEEQRAKDEEDYNKSLSEISASF